MLILSVQTRPYGCIPYKKNSSLSGEVHTEESSAGGWCVCGTLIRHGDAFSFSYMNLLCWRLHKSVSLNFLFCDNCFLLECVHLWVWLWLWSFTPCFFIICRLELCM